MYHLFLGRSSRLKRNLQKTQAPYYMSQFPVKLGFFAGKYKSCESKGGFVLPYFTKMCGARRASRGVWWAAVGRREAESKERASDEKKQNVPVIKQQVFTAVRMLVPPRSRLCATASLQWDAGLLPLGFPGQLKPHESPHAIISRPQRNVCISDRNPPLGGCGGLFQQGNATGTKSPGNLVLSISRSHPAQGDKWFIPLNSSLSQSDLLLLPLQNSVWQGTQ